MASKIKVGDTLWYVKRRNGYNDECEVTVIKVGRKWATISTNERMDLESMSVEAPYYAGHTQCYTTKQDYANEQEAKEKWEIIRGKIEFTYSPALSLASVNKIMELLGIEHVCKCK